MNKDLLSKVRVQLYNSSCYICIFCVSRCMPKYFSSYGVVVIVGAVLNPAI